MRLSEAILLGSTISQQCYSLLFIQRPGELVATCAIGSAGLAIGDCSYLGVEKAFPWATESWFCCPMCDRESRAFSLLHHLNDSHAWTRERIAEWVATIEPPEEPADADVTREREAQGLQSSGTK